MNIFENLENLEVSESCFNDILDIVEELILERNKANREAKKNYEISRGYRGALDFSKHDVKNAIAHREGLIKNLKDKSKDEDEDFTNDTVDEISRLNRIALGRDQNPISYGTSREGLKKIPSVRKKYSQRGTTKDAIERTPSDNLTDKAVMSGEREKQLNKDDDYFREMRKMEKKRMKNK